MSVERKREEKVSKRRDKESSSSSSPRVREDVVLRAADVLRLSHDEARAWMHYQDELGWRFKDGTPVTRWNFLRSLRMWRERCDQVRENRLEHAERAERRKRREAKKVQRPMTSAERHQAEIEEAERRRDAETKAMAARLKRRV